MSEIADFLRARYAERRALAEAAAAKAGSGDWRYRPGDDYVSYVEHDEYASPVNRESWWPLVTEAGSHVGDTLDEEIGNHIAAHGPDAVLADLDAKSFLITGCERALAAAEVDPTTEAARNASEVVERLLRYFAAPFAGHPDHKGEEWAP